MAPVPASANAFGEVQELENIIVRDIALAFMASLLDRYNDYLLAPTANWEVCSAHISSLRGDFHHLTTFRQTWRSGSTKMGSWQLQIAQASPLWPNFVPLKCFRHLFRREPSLLTRGSFFSTIAHKAFEPSNPQYLEPGYLSPNLARASFWATWLPKRLARIKFRQA